MSSTGFAPAERVLTWEPGRGLVPCANEDEKLLVADSWLVCDGRVRGLDRHRQRFFRACIELARLPQDHLQAFWPAMVRQLPRHERWFPRVELSVRHRTELRLRIRPAPPQGGAVRLWVWDGPDPRTAPRTKGPDLGVLAAARRRASSLGAGEALLTTPSGLVLEATHSSLLWWEGPSLCSPSPGSRILPGVTADLIQESAARSGIRVRHPRRRVADLDGCEVWLVNSLHGIRTVSTWVGTSIVAGPALRGPEWQARLEACAEQLPEHR